MPLVFPAVGFLCCGGREGRSDTSESCCLFLFCHVCESDYRSLSQYLASADDIIIGGFISSGPPSHLLPMSCTVANKCRYQEGKQTMSLQH